MKNIFVSILMAIVLFVAPSGVAAQAVGDPGAGSSVNEQQLDDTGAGTTLDDSATQGAVDDRGGLDWRWLLPLLAIPLLFFLWQGMRGDEERREYRDYPVGAKGGKTQRRADDDTEEVL
jgi:hypothetical protein